LLGVILFYALVNPLLGNDVPARGLTVIVSGLAIVQTCVSIVPKRKMFFLSISLALLVGVYGAVVVLVNAPPFNSLAFQAGFRIIVIGFYFFAGILIFRDVIAPGDVDLNKLCGSICLYLIIGVFFGQIYQLCDLVDPGCFVLDLGKLSRHGVLDFFERANLFNYFSFVTLSTLGYGDISPVSRLTRTLAYSEAILGQLYLAVLVSRLVGLHIAASSTANEIDSED
jgi:hypothetical protein